MRTTVKKVVVLEDIERMVKTAKMLLQRDRSLQPIIFFFREGDVIGGAPLQFDNPETKRMSLLAAGRIVSMMGADAVILVDDVWVSELTPEGKKKERGAAISAVAKTKDGFIATMLVPYREQEGKYDFGEAVRLTNDQRNMDVEAGILDAVFPIPEPVNGTVH